MTSDKVWFATGVVLAMLLGTLALATVFGAVVVWALSIFGLVQFSWLKALALGIGLTVLRWLVGGR